MSDENTIPASESENSGGEGGGLGGPDRLSRRDLAVLRRCADRWPILDSERREAVDQVMQIINAEKGISPRTRIAAVKALTGMDVINLKELLVLLQSQKQETPPATPNLEVNVNVGVQQRQEFAMPAEEFAKLPVSEKVRLMKQMVKKPEGGNG